jgi:hypothetical protein
VSKVTPPVFRRGFSEGLISPNTKVRPAKSELTHCISVGNERKTSQVINDQHSTLPSHKCKLSLSRNYSAGGSLEYISAMTEVHSQVVLEVLGQAALNSTHRSDADAGANEVSEVQVSHSERLMRSPVQGSRGKMVA